MILSPVIALTSTMIAIFSGFYATSTFPAERVMFIAVYMILISVTILFIAGSILLITMIGKKHIKKNLNLIYFAGIVSMLFLMKLTVSQWSSIRSQVIDYAKVWDKQEEILLKQPNNNEESVIKNIKPVGGLDGFVENKGWVLGCVRDLYNKNNIKLSE
jgi:hypothetical protein